MQEAMTEETKKELEEICNRMRITSNNFYFQAMKCGNHAFIEFCGLMNDYIDMCVAAMNQGIDFRECNTHSNQALPMKDYQAKYLAEKLDCIYGAQFRASPQVKQAFEGFVSKKTQPLKKKEKEDDSRGA